MEQTSFTYDRELEVNGGSGMTGRWRRVQSVHLTKVIAFGLPDAESLRPVDSSKVPERENYDRTRPVSADRTLPSVRSHYKH